MKKLWLALTFSCLFAQGAMAGDHDVNTNKQLVTEFYQEVLLGGKYQVLDKYIGNTYIQHNPHLPNGKEALRGFLKSLPARPEKAGPSGEIVRVIAEGDLVVLHVNTYDWPTPNGGAIIDIFKVKEGKIVEHWDVIQGIPETSANNNSMF